VAARGPPGYGLPGVVDMPGIAAGTDGGEVGKGLAETLVWPGWMTRRRLCDGGGEGEGVRSGSMAVGGCKVEENDDSPPTICACASSFLAAIVCAPTSVSSLTYSWPPRGCRITAMALI